MKETAGPSIFRRFGLLRAVRACALALAGALVLAGSQAPLPAMDEYVLKAEFLVELIPYFTPPRPRAPGRPIVIAVVGRSPFGTKLDAYASTRRIQNSPVQVVYVQKPSELQSCDLVFICRSERRNAQEILDWARGRGTVTVADDKELLNRGLMVDLLPEGGYLRLYVNPAAVATEKLNIDPLLLRQVKLVPAR